MKKIILTSVALLVAVASFGQKKGETTFEGTLGLTIIPSTTDYYMDGSKVSSNEQSFKFGMNVDLGAGYFFADRWKVAGTVGFDLVDNSSTTFTVKPYVAYYLPIITDFYYVPKVYADFGFGNYITDTKFNSFQAGAGLQLLTFEYRLTSHLGIGISAGKIGYNFTKLKSGYLMSRTNTFVLDINSAAISVVYYL